MKHLFKFLFFIVAILFLSCEQNFYTSEKEIKIVNWNIQTFFDFQKDGNEYSEFLKSKTWNKDSYIERVKRLCFALQKLDADICVLEEIEKQEILFDISNFFDCQWNLSKNYGYSCFAIEKESSLGCAVISRFPLKELSVHNLDVQSQKTVQPKMRSLMQIKVEVDSKSDEKNFMLLVNHWKSKLGGVEETEVWRNYQEMVLANQIESLGCKKIIALGDFNRDINDFYLLDEFSKKSRKVLLRFHPYLDDKKGVLLNSPWFANEKLIFPGSYNYKNEWSRIDNVFFSDDIFLVDFFSATEGPWCDSETYVPRRYKIFNGEGYSDHLPIVCIVRL